MTKLHDTLTRTWNVMKMSVNTLQIFIEVMFTLKAIRPHLKQNIYTSRRNSVNFYQLLTLSMPSSSMVKQVQILHQRRNFLFEVILGTLCLFLMATGAVGVSYQFQWARLRMTLAVGET